MKYYKDETNELYIDPILANHNNLTEITKEVFDAILADNTTTKTEAELIAEYKATYLEIFNTKLKALDYDDIATVGVWAIKDGSKFQAEAKTLLNWYEAIINKNYEILNAVKAGTIGTPTKEGYLLELPSYETFKV